MVIKYLAVFLIGLFVGWVSCSPDEEEIHETITETPAMPASRNPLFRAAAGARPSTNKEV